MLRFPHTLLRYWHILSLDAPTVAALWCWAFGRAARLRLAPWLPAALALGTWLFYVADRLLDARLSPEETLRERHRFHDRHRRWFLAMAAPVALALTVLVARMPRSLIASYCVLGALALLYLVLVHLPVRERGASLPYFPKELATALLFAAASALPAWDEARRRAGGMPRHHPLLLLCPLFALLCWLNCVAIEDWEHHRRGGRIEWLAGLVIALSCFSLILIHQPARWLGFAAALSAILLLLIDGSGLREGGRRIAADLALLTPLLLPVVERFAR
ncbi:MAG TPA: hypothetical protein VE218_13995 [Acidobacteriaceae bacterium]|nr:hypothetical protein [Acidobacteriaceae bacterium]